MATSKQIAARIANGKLSGGPKTAAGKAKSSRNALKFGFFSRSPLIPGEDVAEWDQFHQKLLESLAPANQAQELIVERIIDSAWRLRRFPALEAGIFTVNLRQDEASVVERAASREVEAEEDLEEFELIAQQAEEAAEAPSASLGRAFMHDCNFSGSFLKLTRYEAGIERAFYRNLQALQRLQSNRRSGIHEILAAAKHQKLRNEPTEGLSPIDLAA
jgi:hypothetical protein